MVSTSLLTTKLYIPTPRKNLVARPRLIDTLNGGQDGKLTLISAPAGFGKTTLLAEWIWSSDKSFSWLSLDDGDNNLKRFFTYLIAALQQIDESIGEGILPILEATSDPPIEPLITLLINNIVSIEKEFSFVLDDYHLITNEEIHNAISFLLERLPPNAHIVISGRVDPPITISRLRARDQMTEVRPNDLRFIESEGRIFLNDVSDLDLSPEDIAALLSRTEGWITGLQLAALSMQGRKDKQEFVATFSGSHHYIIDYLVDEVVARQSDEIRSFVYRTSILDRFCAPLSDAVLEISDSRGIIRDIDEANLFLVPLDDERRWYRYHHLFAEFLIQRLQEREPKDIPELHRRASEWFENNDLIVEAVNHSLVGEDYERAALLVESIGPDMMMQSEFDQLEKWLDAMPKELVENWPWLCIIRAWMYDRWAQFDIGENYLLHAEAVVDGNTSSHTDEEEKIIRGQIAAIRALYAIKKGQIPQSIEYSNQALDYLPEGYFNRGVAFYSLGWAKCTQGDLSSAIQEFQEGRRTSLAAGNQILAQVIILDIGVTQILQGHLHQAAETLREAIQFKYEKSEIKIPYAGSASVNLADILREWNELDAAMNHLQEAHEISIPAKLMDTIAIGYASMARVYLAQGDLELAVEVCEKAERMVRDIPDLEPDTKTKTMGSRVWLLLAQNKFTEAARFAQDKGLSADAEINYFIDFKHIFFARILIYLGRENSAAQELMDAHSILAKILEPAKRVGYISQMIEALALQALAFDAQGKHDQALNSLEESLSLAEPEGYIRTFLDEGEPMKSLIHQAVSRKISKAYVSKLLAAFEPDKAKMKSFAQSIVEPLSKREMEVLHLLSTELSGPEIAQELSISLNTMRTHTKSIYSKLNVNNRRAAVRKADELDLF
ncbi:MAG: LuxR C-terminal-related transcriptional regulator [Anaerolineales bacterium]|nr:LuxR C-terminal-related transcriptional regulator [Anaerolineales bacterium]